ncbi:MAG TPA: acetyl-CoA carboxylase biotin carboxyl carrier protein subunit, partial [Pyrinomonadaceae bacterium]|nr:acetyl-CoA carboxylase biotin carboxyl carrier protein subunit [Pyrinomonadaceae bacterium]
VNIADRRDLSKSDSSQTDSGSVELKAKMPGKVVKVLRQIGDEVQAGEGILIIEAMKMQNELSSPKNGKIIDLPVADGATVAAGQKLVVSLKYDRLSYCLAFRCPKLVFQSRPIFPQLNFSLYETFEFLMLQERSTVLQCLIARFAA